LLDQVLNYLWPGIPDDKSPSGAVVRVRQFVHLSRAVSTIALANIINTLLTVFLFWGVIPTPVLMIWTTVSLWASGNRLYAWYKHRDWPAPEKVERRTLISSTFWGAMGGIMWGAMGLGMAWQGSMVHHVFLAFVIGGQAAAAAVWMSSVLSSSYAYIWLSVGPLGIGLILRDEPITTVMGIMVLFFMLASFQLARRTHEEFQSGIRSNLELQALNERLIESEQRYRRSEETLTTAIDAMDAGFVIFDAADRLVMANAKYRDIYKGSASKIAPGVKFEELLRYGLTSGVRSFPGEEGETWISGRLAEHAKPSSTSEQLLQDGRWLQISERKTSDGSTVGFRFDITKLKRAQEDFRQARDEAEAASLAKSEFLSSMSHELRTPLNAILGFAQLLDTDPSLPLQEDQQESVDQILSGGRHLLTLIEQVLDLARIETGNIAVSLETVVLADVYRDCVPIAETLASKREITLKYTPADPSLALLADTTRLKQVLLNLLSNAVKYNKHGGEVTLSSTPTDHGTIVIAVGDSGAGIPPEKQEMVFEPFNRLGAETSATEGTGIGLTISKELVHLMNGSIDFESKLGEGSIFRVELPMATARQAAPDIDEADAALAARTAAADDREEDDGRLLYVEDNPANLRLMERIVERIPNLQLLSAHTAELGLELARAHLPDLIFMDIGLPGMNGYEAIEHLKSDPATAHIPVVAVSASVTKSDIDRGREAGFADYVPKPLQIDQILAHVNNALNRKTN